MWFTFRILQVFLFLLKLFSVIDKSILITKQQEENPLLELWPYVLVGGLFFS